MKRFFLTAGLGFVIGLWLIASVQPAQAFTAMQDSDGWLIYLTKFKENANAILYEGTLVRPADEDNGVDRADWDIAAAYRKTSQKLSLTVRKFGAGTNLGLLTYDLDRTSETRFKGFWWQSFKGDEEYTRTGTTTVTITLTTSGDFPGYSSGSGTGDGP